MADEREEVVFTWNSFLIDWAHLPVRIALDYAQKFDHPDVELERHHLTILNADVINEVVGIDNVDHQNKILAGAVKYLAANGKLSQNISEEQGEEVEGSEEEGEGAVAEEEDDEVITAEEEERKIEMLIASVEMSDEEEGVKEEEAEENGEEVGVEEQVAAAQKEAKKSDSPQKNVAVEAKVVQQLKQAKDETATSETANAGTIGKELEKTDQTNTGTVMEQAGEEKTSVKKKEVNEEKKTEVKKEEAKEEEEDSSSDFDYWEGDDASFVPTPSQMNEDNTYVFPRGPDIKILTLGNSGAGKSGLLVRYTEEKFQPEHVSTIGIDFRAKTLSFPRANIQSTVQIWDTAGQERFRTITRNYYRGAHAVLLVYDICNRDSFRELEHWIDGLGATNLTKGENGRRPPAAASEAQALDVVVVGNKCDLPTPRQVSRAEGRAFAEKYGLMFFETSALTGKNVHDAFTCLSLHALRRQKAIDEETFQSYFNRRAEKRKSFKQRRGSHPELTFPKLLDINSSSVQKKRGLENTSSSASSIHDQMRNDTIKIGGWRDEEEGGLGMDSLRLHGLSSTLSALQSTDPNSHSHGTSSVDSGHASVVLTPAQLERLRLKREKTLLKATLGKCTIL